MRFEKGTIKASPYIGVFSLVTEKIALVPHSLCSKELKQFKIFDVELIKCSLGESSLLGVLSAAIADKVLISDIVTQTEKDFLENAGLKTKVVKGATALGNLVKLTENAGIVGSIFSSNQIKEMASFLKINLIQKNIAGSDLVGSNCCASIKGFLVNPEISEEEFSFLKKTFKVNGEAGTANYGDRFVGNCVLANGNGVLTGLNTTGYELIRIDDGLRGE